MINTNHFILLIFVFLFIESSENLGYEGKGFIVYCPCMGRFGNQAEQLLGSLLFAHSLNRTLVLPPFIYYGKNHKPNLVPFDQILQVEPIKQYHDVLLMDEFLPQWPVGERTFFCYSTRRHGARTSCDALGGEPFLTFWRSYNVSEDVSIFYSPLSTHPKDAKTWNESYPVSKYPVLAFVGAPSPFPTHKESIHIQRYLRFSEHVKKLALDYKHNKNFSSQPYLSIHLRRGIDWRKACELLKTNDHLPRLFSSNQCTGYPDHSDLQPLHYDTCFPATDTIIKNIRDTLKYYRNKTGQQINIVHVGTDMDDSELWSILKSEFSDLKFIINPSRDTIQDVLIDIYLMANADVFIGNCVSSFSAFSARIRNEQYGLKLMTLYFGQFFEAQISPYVSDEL